MPDYGPPRPHPTAGAVLATARPAAGGLQRRPRDATTSSSRRSIAAGAARVRRRAARRARARPLPADRGRAQVSTNVHDHWRCRCAEIVERVRARAPVAEAELIGLAPRAAFEGFPGGRAAARFQPRAPHPRRGARGPSGNRRLSRLRAWLRPSASAPASTAAPPPARSSAPAARAARSTREDAKQIARQRRAERLDKPPTWRGAMNRAAIAAAVFGVLVVLAVQARRRPGRGARGVHVPALHPARLRDRHGDLPLPPAAQGRPAAERWTCACSPSARWPRTPTSSAATARTAR